MVKIFAGIAIGWISNHYYPNNDYWILNQEGLNEFAVLKNNPKAFFTNILYSPYENAYGGFFDAVGSYWNDLKNNTISKTLALIDIFSNGNYYINSLFLNFFAFFGQVALYKIFKNIFPSKQNILIACCFLIPTTIYFSAGIHKDLFVFTALALYCYALYFMINDKLNWKRIFLIICAALVLLLMRNFLLVALIPATIGFILSSKLKFNSSLIFASTYTICIIAIWAATIFIPSRNPLKIITQRQEEFLKLPTANSQIKIDTLKPSFGSFVKNAPQAINHGLLRPYLWESKSYFSILLALELLLFQILFILMLAFKEKKIRFLNPFAIFGVYLALSMFIITGYIIPNTNSIVRYKSIFLPLIIAPIVCNIRFKSESTFHI